MCKTELRREVVIQHREPNLLLCDDLERGDEGWGGRLERQMMYVELCLICSGNQHDIVKQFSSNNKYINKSQINFVPISPSQGLQRFKPSSPRTNVFSSTFTTWACPWVFTSLGAVSHLALCPS